MSSTAKQGAGSNSDNADAGPTIIAHQYAEPLAGRTGAALEGGIALVAISADVPWAMPAGAEALLVDPPVAGRLSPSPPRPDGWPGSLRWVHMRSTGVDRFPAWIFDVRVVTISRGAQAVAIAKYVLMAMLAFEKKFPGLWINRHADWGRHFVRRRAGGERSPVDHHAADGENEGDAR